MIGLAFLTHLPTHLLHDHNRTYREAESTRCLQATMPTLENGNTKAFLLNIFTSNIQATPTSSPLPPVTDRAQFRGLSRAGIALVQQDCTLQKQLGIPDSPSEKERWFPPHLC